MLLDEFVKLTGYRPSYKEYERIERNYMAFNGDKQAFCKAWIMVNSATVEQYKADESKLNKMRNTMEQFMCRAVDIDSVIEHVRSHLVMWEKRKELCAKSIRKLDNLISAHKEQMCK